jgi:hypothetical protein
MEQQETQSHVPFVQELLDKLESALSTTPDLKQPRKNISSGEDAFLNEEQYGTV